VEREFTVIVQRDLESGWLIGSVLELPGCHTEAEDEAGLHAAIQEALALYLMDAEVEETYSEFVGTFKIHGAVPSAA